MRPSHAQRGVCLALISSLLTQCVFAHSTEINFWEERQNAFSRPQAPVVLDAPALPGVSLSQFGTLRQSKAPTAKTVIHIQDVHLNAEAQENIHQALNTLIRSGKIELVAVEGAFAPINIDRFRSFKNQGALRNAARYAFSKNEISGPVYALLTNDASIPPLVGVDDETAYHANVAAYTGAAPQIGRAKRRIETQRAANEAAARAQFSPALWALHQKSNAYHSGTLSAGEYLLALEKSGAALPLTLETFLEAFNIEKTLDIQRVEAERAQFIPYLLSKIDKNAVHELETAAASHRLGLVNQAEFYSRLKNVCRENGVSLSRAPALDAYINYVLLSDNVDAEKLYAALRETESDVFHQLARTSREKEIINETRRLYLAEKLTDFSLSKAEWQEYKPADAFLAPFESFYREAEKRDRLMSENLLKEMNRTGAKTAVLVAGGFHAAGLSARLKQNGIGVSSFAPRITTVQTDSGAKALSLFIQEKAPLEKLFEGEKLFLAPNPANLIPLPFETIAVEAITTPSAPAQESIDALLPLNHGIVVETERQESNRVSVMITTPKGRVQNVFQMSPAGAIVSAQTSAVKSRFRPNLAGLLKRALALRPAFNDPSAAETILMAAGQRLGLPVGYNHAVLKPRRVVKMNIVFARDTENGGRLARHQAYRVQHLFGKNKPSKGGIRFDKNVSLPVISQLALEMTIKVTLLNLPLGGGKGGVRIKPHEHTPAELSRVMRAYVRGLIAQNALSPDIDSPAPDVGTTPDLMAVFADEYLRTLVRRGTLVHSKLNEIAKYAIPDGPISPSSLAVFDRDSYPGAGLDTPFLDAYTTLSEAGELPASLLSIVTGKPVSKKGINGRVEATGRGVALVTREAVKTYMGRDMQGVKIALQGFGNVGFYTAKILREMGAVIISVGEWDGTIVNKNGIDPAALKRYMLSNNGGVTGFSGGEYTNDKNGWLVGGADVVIPAAREDVLNTDNIDLFPASAKLIVEAANGPVTAHAEKRLSATRPDVRVIPDALANAGGVFVSHKEMLYDNGLVSDVSEQAVNADLEKNILSAARAVFETAEKENLSPREAMGHIVMDRLSKADTNREPRFNALPEILIASVIFTAPHLLPVDPHLLLGNIVIGSIMVRAIWFVAFFIHGLGHGAVKWLVDKNHPFNTTDSLEGATLSEFIHGLIPFSRIHTPWFSERRAVTTGNPDPLKVRLKAAGGPLFNALAASALYVLAAHYFYLSTNPYLAMAIMSGIVLNTAFAVLSVSDFVSLFTGRAPFGFSCGYLDYVAPRTIGTDGAALVPAWMRDNIEFSTEILSDRGKQAYGFEMKARDRNGNVVLVGLKDVNPKRSELHTRLRQDIDRENATAERDGYKPLDDVIDYSSHLRFGTSSEPSRIETHPHPSPEEVTDQYDWSDGSKPITREKRIFQISVKHNGDNDGIKTEEDVLKDHPVFAFSKEMSYNDIREQMNRILYKDITKGDSPVIASMLALFTTRGRFPASARLAYLMLSNTLNNSFSGLSTPQQISKVVKKWGAVFEDEFLHHQKNIFINRGGKWIVNKSYMNDKFIPALQNRIKSDATIKNDPFLSSFSEYQLNEFAQTTMFLFLEHSTGRAIQMMMATALPTSTFGLSVNNTLEPKKKFWVAKGQPGALGYNPDTGAFIAASDPGAVLGGLNNRSKLLNFNDDQGEIIVLDMEKPREPKLKLFSLSQHRELSAAEISARWISLAKNPYVKLPAQRVAGASVLKQDVADLNGIIKAVNDGFDPKNRTNTKAPSNRLSSDRFNQQLIKMAHDHREWREEKLRAWLKSGKSPGDYREERSQEADILFIAEGPSFDIALRKKGNLEKLCPGLNVQIVQGNEYMANKDAYYNKSGTSSFYIGKKTIVFGISQSGMTFSNVEAIRDAEIMRKAGNVKDVYVLTGSWFSVLGRSIGQNYFPDSEFSGRIFSNMSGRRPSEAPTVAAATDFLLTRIFIDAMKALSASVPEGSMDYAPLNMKLSTEALERLEQEIEPMINGGLSNITGTDAAGKTVDSSIHKNLLGQGRDIANHVSEQTFSLFSVRLYTLFSVLFHLSLFRVIALIITFFIFLGSEQLSGLSFWQAIPALAHIMPWGLWAIAHVLDTIFYSFQDVFFTYGLRLLQNRAILDRLGPRTLAIGSPHWSLLRDYFRAALLEAPGFLQLAHVDGRRVEGDFMHRFKDAARGVLILFQFDDSRESTTTQSLKAGAAKMSVNQAAGVRNWGAGPHILINTLNPGATKRYKYEAVAVADHSDFDETDSILRNEAFRTFHSHWFNELKLLVSGQVIAAEMADVLTKVKIPFYLRRNNTFTSRVLEKGFGVVTRVYSALFIEIYSFYMQWRYRTAPTNQIFEAGKGQSGLTVFTTQLVAPRPNKTGTRERNLPHIIHALRNEGLDATTPWIPSVGPIASVYALLYDPISSHNIVDTVVDVRSRVEAPAHTATKEFAWGSFSNNGSVTVKSPALVGVLAVLASYHAWHAFLGVAFIGVIAMAFNGFSASGKKKEKHRATRLGFESLETRRTLSGQSAAVLINQHYDDVPALVSDMRAAPASELARDNAFAELTSPNVRTDGREWVTTDKNHRVTEIRVEVSVDGIASTFLLNDFKYDSRGQPVSFTLIEKNGPTGAVRTFEGHVVEYDKKGRPLTALAVDKQNGVEIDIAFFPAGGVKTLTVIESDNKTTVVSIETENIHYDESTDESQQPDEPSTAKKEEPVLPQSASGTPSKSQSTGNQSSSNPLTPALDTGSGGGDVDRKEAVGIPPEDVIALLPPRGGAAAPQEPEAIEDAGPVAVIPAPQIPAVQKTVELKPAAPPVSAEEKPVARIESGWIRLDTLAVLVLGLGATISRAAKKKEKKPEVRISRNRKKLTLFFPAGLGVQVRGPSGFASDRVDFLRHENGYSTADGRMTAVVDPEKDVIHFSSVENGYRFIVLNGRGTEKFSTFSLPVKNSVAARMEKTGHASTLTPFVYAFLTGLIVPVIIGLAPKIPDLNIHLPHFETISLLYWGGLLTAGASFLLAIREPANKRAQISWTALGRRLMFRTVFLAAVAAGGALALKINLAPMSFLTMGIWMFYGTITAGYLFVDVGSWMGTLFSLVFLRWIPSVAAKSSRKKDLRAILGISMLAAIGYLAARTDFYPVNMNEQLAPVNQNLSTVDWPAPVSPAPVPVEKRPADTELSYVFENVSPLLYEPDADAIAVPVLAHKDGYLKLDAAANVRETDWKNTNRVFRVTGGGPLLTLTRPVTEAKATGVRQLSGALKKIYDHYKRVGAYDKELTTMQARLFDQAEYLLKKIENYDREQEVDVFGRIRVPLTAGEGGWVLPGHRPLGNATPTTVLARVHSEKRLTVRIEIPAGVWQRYDVMRMKTGVRLNGAEHPARVINMSIEPRLNGSMVLTLGLLSDHQIFNWNETANRADAVTVHVEFPLRKTPVSYSGQLPPESLMRSYAQTGRRVSYPVNTTGAIGRAAFNTSEASWVQSGQTVAGVSQEDRQRLNDLSSETKQFTADTTEYLQRLKKLIEQRIAPLAPTEARQFADDFVQIRELLAMLSYMDYQAPRMGLLTETLNTQGQAVQNTPVARVLTPQIPIQHRVPKNVAVQQGDVVIVRRPSTGDETLGIVRQVNQQLTDEVRGEDQSRFQDVLIEVNNVPGLWLADNEYDVEVLYAPAGAKPSAQPWLKQQYQERDKSLTRLYGQTDLASMPRLFPVRFVVPASTADKLLLIENLEKPVDSFDLNSAGAGLPDGPVVSPALSINDTPEIRRLLSESNGDQRRTWMRLFLQKHDIPMEEIQQLALNGQTDIAQMGLDYLLSQRRVVDLIVLHRSLYEKNPGSDMARLARQHALELIESGSNSLQADDSSIEDPMKRLMQLTDQDPHRAVAQEFLVSVLSMKNAATDPETALAVRRILQSDFWRTYADKLALARALENAGQKEAAALVRNAVFAHIAEHVGWKLGPPQEEASTSLTTKWLDTGLWVRLENMSASHAQDLNWLENSPWVLSGHFDDLLNPLLYGHARTEYEALTEESNALPAAPLTVLPLTHAGVRADHEFGRLDALTQRNGYTQTLTLHALARFLTIAERLENIVYRERREQVLTQLINDNTPLARFLLARGVAQSNDPAFLKLAAEKDIDNILVQETLQLVHDEKKDPGVTAVYQSALAKLAGSLPDDGRRRLALRTAIQTVSDFELNAIADGRHGYHDALVNAGLPKKVVVAAAREEMSRRALHFAIPIAKEWSELTLNPQVYAGAGSTLKNIEEAMAPENFNPARLQQAMADAVKTEPAVIKQLTAFAHVRHAQIERGADRDNVGPLETWRVSIGLVLGFAGVLFGGVLRVLNVAKSKGMALNERKRGIFGKFFLWPILTGAALLAMGPSVQAAPVSSQPVPPIVETAPTAAARTILRDAPAVRSNELYQWGEQILERRREGRRGSNVISLWEVSAPGHIATLKKTLGQIDKPDYKEAVILMATPDMHGPAAALKTELERGHPNRTVIVAVQNSMDPARAIETACLHEEFSEYKKSLRARKAVIDLFAASPWRTSERITIDTEDIPAAQVFSKASLHWIELINGMVLSVPVSGSLDQSFDALLIALKHA